MQIKTSNHANETWVHCPACLLLVCFSPCLPTYTVHLTHALALCKTAAKRLGEGRGRATSIVSALPLKRREALK